MTGLNFTSVDKQYWPEECPVCWEETSTMTKMLGHPFNQYDSLKFHAFCEPCVKELAKKLPICPLDRRQISHINSKTLDSYNSPHSSCLHSIRNIVTCIFATGMAAGAITAIYYGTIGEIPSAFASFSCGFISGLGIPITIGSERLKNYCIGNQRRSSSAV